ncbi:MAG: hypothetical protein CME59_17755 [Halioglobus sp.]|nr:hypothetical protein [Halioglobus sp.]|tara:strand:- start:1427 stop:2464 length:1038 start_codon:yes stop_codon:yes gene_type:complete
MRPFYRRRRTTKVQALARPAKPHPLDEPLRALYRADGTQSNHQFQQQTLPLLHALHRAARRRDPATADQSLIRLMTSIVDACRRAANVRLPLGVPVSDYRRYETRYNYALISAMAITWYREAEGLEPGEERVLAETLLPSMGLERLREEPLVWEHWQAFFSGNADGGLREIAGQSLPTDSEAESTAVLPRSCGDRQEASKTPAGQHRDGTGNAFLSPPSHRRANPQAKGWVLVDTIREGLRDGSLSYNDKASWVQVDKEGRTFLQVPEVFEWCHARLNPDVPPKTLINQFGRLHVCIRSRNGQNLLRGGRRHQNGEQQGFVIEDPALFWDGKPPTGQFFIRHLTQ